MYFTILRKTKHSVTFVRNRSESLDNNNSAADWNKSRKKDVGSYQIHGVCNLAFSIFKLGIVYLSLRPLRKPDNNACGECLVLAPST